MVALMPAFLSTLTSHSITTEKCLLDSHYHTNSANHSSPETQKKSFAVKSLLIFGFKRIALTFRYHALEALVFPEAGAYVIYTRDIDLFFLD